MRRLVLLVAVVVAVDTMLYAALTPLLPHLAHELGLSKSRAGALVAAYAAGALVAGFAGGIAATRFGPRRAVLLGAVRPAEAIVAVGVEDRRDEQDQVFQQRVALGVAFGRVFK